MKIISRVEIVNFQSHSYSDLYFKKGVNVIVGPSDSGKTAIIRAIKWVLFNEPSGSAFVKQGSEETKVILYFDDNTVIERGKTKKKNYYVLKRNGKEERYEGFGVNVPKEIEEASDISKIPINDQHLIISIADQLESPFLITKTPSVKSTAIGVLAGTNIIDKASSNLSKEIYEEKNSLKTHERILATQEEELTQYAYLKKEKIDLNEIDTLLKKIDGLGFRLDNLIVFRNKYQSIDEEIKRAENILIRLQPVLEIENLLTAAIPLYNLYKQYKRMSKMKDAIVHEESFLSEIMNKTNHLKDTEKSLTLLENLFKKYSNFRHLKTSWRSLSEKIKAAEKILSHIDIDKINSVEYKINRALKQYDILKRYSLELKVLETRIEKGNRYLQRYENIDVLGQSAKDIDEYSNKLKEYTLLKAHLLKIHSNIDILKTEINKRNNTIYRIIGEYENILKNISTCPYCKSKIDIQHRKSIVKEMRDDYGL